MKVALAQMNTTPGAFSEHRNKIFRAIIEAGEQQCDLLVFPELTASGYLSADFMYRSNYVQDNLFTLNGLVCDTSVAFPDLTIVVGHIGYNTTGGGKPFTNSATVVRNGCIVTTYNKQLLPFYDVFDEGRYFEPGTQPCVIKIGKHRCGIMICEDLWNDKGQDDYNHHNNPVETYKQLGCDTLISLNSSPYAVSKPEQRLAMLEYISREHSLTILYCNQVGGQDELIFDGHSVMVKNGRVFAASQSEETLLVEETEHANACADQATKQIYASVRDRGLLKRTLVLGLQDYVYKSGFNKVVLGSSGGIDSAVVAALAAEALGPENVMCIMMPSRWSSEGSVNDARELHKMLGVQERRVPIDYEQALYLINQHLQTDAQWFEPGKSQRPDGYNIVADENFQARMRGQIVMHYSNATGALPLTTGNKTELALGYCTLYGDMNGGFNPICDLYKLQVYALARMLNVPKAILEKPPSAELAPGQTDEKGLKLPYTILDVIVRAYIEDYIASYSLFKKAVEANDLYTQSGQREEVLEWVNQGEDKSHLYKSIIRRIDIMEFKRRQAAPGLKVSRIAFGTGRRMPIVKSLKG